MNVNKRFELIGENGKHYMKFEDVKNKQSNRPDIHAFLLLDKLYTSDQNIVSAASHDIIYLNFNSKKIEELTDKQILELTRCGVMYDDEYDSLSMFI
jgi:hypothetical protein